MHSLFILFCLFEGIYSQYCSNDTFCFDEEKLQRFTGDISAHENIVELVKKTVYTKETNYYDNIRLQTYIFGVASYFEYKLFWRRLGCINTRQDEQRTI